MMNADHWRRLQEIFHAALALPATERSAFLDEHCGDDADLRREIEELLTASEDELTLLEQPAVFALQTPELPPPVRIGPYRIMEELGRGGMGTVYAAERDDPQFQQRVAIKVVRRGLDTEDILSRFYYERQILALLDHPHIARLYDGGMTDEGRPYFVMEHVHGQPITTYCDQHRLNTQARLALFQTVCDAVQYAHQNLVIHRDLKPSNILVTEDGLVKLLDFGIAKLLDEDPTSAPVTRTGLRLMTPEYASPEQIQGQPITTATDVYQLGVLLYELLTGHRPYRLGERVRQEIERVILEEEPTRPSTIIGQTSMQTTGAETATISPETISATRNTNVEKLKRALAGDLDNIVLRALKKTPDQRYATVEQFREDVRRHLAGLPVLAQADSLGYRLGKFVRRHRTGVLTSAGVLALSLVFGIFYTVQVTAARDRAETEATRAERINQFLLDVFAEGHSYNERTDTLTVRTALKRSIPKIETDLADQPDQQAQLYRSIGSVYLQLSQNEEAYDLYQRALRAHERATDKPDRFQVLLLNSLAGLKNDMGETDVADSLMQAAMALYESLDIPRDTLYGEMLFVQGDKAYGEGNVAAAEAAFTEALELERQWRGDDAILTLLTQLRLGDAIRHDPERRDEAMALFQDVHDLGLAAHGPDDYIIPQSLTYMAILQKDLGEFEASIAAFKQVLDFEERVLGPTHYQTGGTHHWMAITYFQNRQFAEAETAFSAAATIYAEHAGSRSYDVGNVSDDIGLSLYYQARYDEAVPYFQQAEALYQEHVPDGHQAYAYAYLGLGRIALARHETEAAIPYFEQARQIREAVFGEDRRTAEALMLLGAAELQRNQPATAEPLLLAAYEQFENSTGSILHEEILHYLIALYQTTGDTAQVQKYQTLAAPYTEAPLAFPL